jgi:hypothetical protein
VPCQEGPLSTLDTWLLAQRQLSTLQPDIPDGYLRISIHNYHVGLTPLGY